MTTDTSKPAFPADPYTETGERNQNAGLTAREYFAARAPAEIPDWFKGPISTTVVPVEPRQVVETAHDEGRITDDQLRTALNWLRDDAWDLDSDLQWVADHAKLFHELQREHREDTKRLRYFAWRWYYADMMLASGQWSPTKLEGC